MKATGQIRRVDDLGRVVIPKEVRRTLKIREGDPLEIFVQDEAVCFMKCQKYDHRTWELADKIMSPIISNYAILDGYGECVRSKGIKVLNEQEAKLRDDVVIEHIRSMGDSLAYLVIRKDNNTERIGLAREVLKKLLEDEEE